MLAKERRRPTQLSRDPLVSPTKKSRLQARWVERYLIQRTGRLEPYPAFYDWRTKWQLVELSLVDQARSSQTKLVPRLTIHKSSVVACGHTRVDDNRDNCAHEESLYVLIALELRFERSSSDDIRYTLFVRLIRRVSVNNTVNSITNRYESHKLYYRAAMVLVVLETAKTSSARN